MHIKKVRRFNAKVKDKEKKDNMDLKVKTNERH